MPVKLASLLDLNADDVELARVKLRLWLTELNPNLDFTSGVLHDLLLLAGAAQYAGFSAEFDRLRLSQSLMSIAANPTLADTDTVDKLLSNYGVTRKAGSNSTGQMAIVLTRATDLVLPAGFSFLANNITYTTTQTFSAKASEVNVRTSADRLLIPLTDSTWVFLVTAVSAVEGSSGRLTRGTAAVPSQIPAYFRAAYAAADFSDASSAELTSDVISRVKFGYALKSLAGRSHMQALLEGMFQDTVSSSIVGANDVEMVRDQRTIFPVSTLGKVDWYVRTAVLPVSISHIVSATLVSSVGSAGTWQFTLPASLAPGFYSVESVKLPNTPYTVGGFNVLTDVISGDLTESVWHPDLVGLDFAYTPYQVRTITFVNDVTSVVGVAIGTKANYEVTTYGLPGLKAVQAVANSREELPPGGDVCVRAPIPFRLAAEVTIEKPLAAATPDTDKIRLDMARVANSVGFAGLLTTTSMADAAYNSLTGGAVISKITLLGDLRYPDGSHKYPIDNLVLRVPYEPAKGVTSKTVNFFLHPEDVQISLQNFT